MPQERFQEPFYDETADETLAAIKTDSGYLFFVQLSNIDSAGYFLQLFDAAVGDVTLGTTTPTLSLPVPPGDATDEGASIHEFDPPIRFKTAITYAVTTTAGGSTGPTTALTMNAGVR